jgi:putative proteasome-type protease
MTFCIGIKVREGILALADSRIVVGADCGSKRKLTGINHVDGSVFVMTSGLRSVRDKTLTYLGDVLQQHEPCTRVYQVVNQFGVQLRKVWAEDGASLTQSGLAFNSHAIIGGRLSGDAETQLYYVYPQGNWIECASESPYFIIGRSSYGKPILDRLLRFETPLRQAVLLALLAFDATRTSVTDVDAPIDVATLAECSERMTFRRFADNDFAESTDWWAAKLKEALAETPHQWIDTMFAD